MVKLGVIALSIAVILVAAVFFYFANAISGSSENIYYSQKSMEQSLQDLNATIQTELEYQKVLTDKVTELAVKADLPPPVINTTKTVQAPPTVVKVPATPTPVTRAS